MFDAIGEIALRSAGVRPIQAQRRFLRRLFG
jgi:hypothetical protein